MIFMNMEVSNEELKELLDKFMKRLDKMDKERDVMKKKLDRMHNHIKNVNKALDELYYSMDDGQEIEFNLTEEDLEFNDISSPLCHVRHNLNLFNYVGIL
jgi:uncharacterized coiled-coil DUF342 family protein